MTFEQMKIFVAAAQYGSFTIAAEKLGLTQSAVSVSIKKLEEKYGVTLFDRSGRRLRVTEAGQVLLTEAERILRDVDLTILRLESHRSLDDRYSIVACTPNAYDFWMPKVLSRISEASELPRIELVRGRDEEIKAWVMRGTAEVGITEIEPSHPQFHHFRVFSDRFVLAGTPSIAAAVKSPSWETLTGLGPILWEESDLTPILMQAFEDNQIDARRIAHKRLHLASTAAIVSALEDGRCAGFVAEHVACHALASGTLVRIGRIEIPIHYWMFSLKEREIEAFVSSVAGTPDVAPAA
ncbi:MAG: LysR family transcriptional regulator [Beijerinckiaceae bacterium]|nr:MAG: LysR family transcriptional regulator [Beijerinckiaceae bacterium]